MKCLATAKQPIQLDLAHETKKLRKRSPLSSTRLLCVAAMVVVFNAVVLGGYLFNEKAPDNPMGVFLPYLVLFCVFIGAAIVVAFWRRTRMLIKNGVVCQAEVADVIRWPRGYWSITVVYYANGISHHKNFRLATHHAAVVDQLGVLYVVALPRKPRTVEPLYLFARIGRESKRIIACQSGLSES